MFSMSGMMVEAQWMTNCGAWRKASPIEEATLWYLVCWRNMYENNCYSMLFRLSLHKGCWMCGHDCNKCIQGLHVVGTHSEPACSISGATLLWPAWLQGCPPWEGQATGICGIDAPVGGISDPKFSTAGCRNYRTQSFISKPKTWSHRQLDQWSSVTRNIDLGNMLDPSPQRLRWEPLTSSWGLCHQKSSITSWTANRRIAVHLKCDLALGDLLRPSKMNLELETLLFEDPLCESPKRTGMGK